METWLGKCSAHGRPVRNPVMTLRGDMKRRDNCALSGRCLTNNKSPGLSDDMRPTLDRTLSLSPSAFGCCDCTLILFWRAAAAASSHPSCVGTILEGGRDEGEVVDWYMRLFFSASINMYTSTPTSATTMAPISRFSATLPVDAESLSVDSTD